MGRPLVVKKRPTHPGVEPAQVVKDLAELVADVPAETGVGRDKVLGLGPRHSRADRPRVRPAGHGGGPRRRAIAGRPLPFAGPPGGSGRPANPMERGVSALL
ncbi:hypothetical protein QFZ56_007310 [Streptomyces achromogenes]|uniref:Uncharacterized protein n=1 Tax=Streptomyces achromogenes TaxID=67255 RepID=A0ABU0QCI2_STRAH|nr:hypothetical protein [Streptomyces achromogenes]MDQ0688347.1 hypothetical protein [Streptomyces achromogenes]